MEITIVLAILGLALVLVGVGRAPVSAATKARAAAQQISEALRVARGEALAQDRSVTFTLDVANRSFRSGDEPPVRLPNGVHLELLTSIDNVAATSVGQIRFDPDGGASGGRVTVEGGGRVWQVGVDWISGRVTLVEGKS